MLIAYSVITTTPENKAKAEKSYYSTIDANCLLKLIAC